MSEWNRVLERDTALCARMAAQGDLTAGLIMRAREVERERQQRASEADERRRRYQDEIHRRAIAAASAPIAQQAPGEFTQEEMIVGIARGVSKRLAPLEEKLATVERASGTLGLALDIGLAGIEARIDEIESKPGTGFKYLGVWNSEKAYTVNDCVTDKGSLFICKDGCINVRPGTSNAWQLAVQRGKDGRDRR
jgi:hypothetical protein